MCAIVSLGWVGFALFMLDYAQRDNRVDTSALSEFNHLASAGVFQNGRNINTVDTFKQNAQS